MVISLDTTRNATPIQTAFARFAHAANVDMQQRKIKQQLQLIETYSKECRDTRQAYEQAETNLAVAERQLRQLQSESSSCSVVDNSLVERVQQLPHVAEVYCDTEQSSTDDIGTETINIVLNRMLFNGDGLRYPTPSPRFDNCRMIIYHDGSFALMRIAAGHDVHLPQNGHDITEELSSNARNQIQAALDEGRIDFAVAVVIITLQAQMLPLLP